MSPRRLLYLIRSRRQAERLRREPSLQGALTYPPGHFHSPLLDLQCLGPDTSSYPGDGAECWEQIDLRLPEQIAYYQHLLSEYPPLPFPRQPGGGYRYYTENVWFPEFDAYTLSGVIRRERPARIIEIGSGFSSAVMLDTLEQSAASVALTFIEPNPSRLESLLSERDRKSTKIIAQEVQQVGPDVFAQLEAQDILFIDSSHVAKLGSDVTFLMLRILPRLRAGVLVHFHDIFYPFSYPPQWIREGRAWNESLFLRAFLIGNRQFEIVAFNSYAGYTRPDVFKERHARFLDDTGGSIWLRKTE